MSLKKASVLLISLLIILTPLAYAADAFGAIGHKEGDNSEPGSEANIDNWPQKAKDICKKAQDNALKKCEEFGSKYNPGGWWVDRQISAQTHSGKLFNGKNINVNIDDIIVGKWDCPPHELLVDKSGNLIEQRKIYSEYIDYAKSKAKDGSEDDVEIVCSFGCSAWPCPTEEDLDPKTDCTDKTFDNKKTGQSVDEFVKEQVEKKLGIREMCEWKEGCKLVSYKHEIIKMKNGTTIVRICAKCSCDWLKLEPNYDPSTYTPLSYDPFVEILEKPKKKDLESLMQVYNDNSDKIPENLKSIVGNERIILDVTNDKGEKLKYGIVMENGKIKEFKKGSLSNATLQLTTTQKVIESIQEAPDPANAVVVAMNDGSIKLKSLNSKNSMKVFVTQLFTKIMGLFSKNKFDIKPGQKITITFKGKDVTLEGNPHGVRVVTIPQQKDRYVVNRFGSSIAYTNKRAQNVVVAQPKRYNRNAGIYTYPRTNYSNYWQRNSYTRTLPTYRNPYSSYNMARSAYSTGRNYVTMGGFSGAMIR